MDIIVALFIVFLVWFFTKSLILALIVLIGVAVALWIIRNSNLRY